MVVGEFEYVEGKSPEGIQVRVFTPIGKKEQVRKSLSKLIFEAEKLIKKEKSLIVE